MLGLVFQFVIAVFALLLLFGLGLLFFHFDDRLIDPGHHSFNRFLLVLFYLEVVNVHSMGPLFAA